MRRTPQPLAASCLLVLFCAATAAAQVQPEFQPAAEDPALPRVLLLGDSISIGYTLPVRKLLAGKANVQRPAENCGPTSHGVARLDAWLGAGRWDVIHFNFGLHDVKYVGDARQVSPEDYERNLRTIVARLQKTGAKLVWCSTTPVPAGKVSPPREDSDVQAYNAVARRVMEEHGVAIHDLYAFAAPRLAEIQQSANVHFKPAGSQQLAEQVAQQIERALAAPPK